MRKPLNLPQLYIPGADEPETRLTMPRSMFYLTCVSLFFSFLLLLFSLLDFGAFSLYMNPLASIFTIIYHTGVLIVSQRKRKLGQPSYFFTVVACSWLLTVIWLVAFILTIVVIVTGKDGITPAALRSHGLPVSVHTQRLQCFLSTAEFILMAALSFVGQFLLKEEGDPQTWRPERREGEKKAQIRVVRVQGTPPHSNFINVYPIPMTR